jgi:hypothetical protein
VELSAGAEVDATECCAALVEKAALLEKAADAAENAPGQMARWRGRMVGGGIGARWREDGGRSGAVERAVVAWSCWSTRAAVRTRQWCGEWRGTTTDSRADKVGRADMQVENWAVGLMSWPIKSGRMDVLRLTALGHDK